jgi:hypothetical protein
MRHATGTKEAPASSQPLTEPSEAKVIRRAIISGRKISKKPGRTNFRKALSKKISFKRLASLQHDKKAPNLTALVQLKEKVKASMFITARIRRVAVTLLAAGALLLNLNSAAFGINSRRGSIMTGEQESQQKKEPQTTPPQARAEDVASMDAILAALYDVISGPAGKKRDWNRMRSLFIPEGRLMAVGPRKEGGFGYRVMDVDGYIKSSGNYLETNGFFESEVSRVVEQFGQIAHVFSTYESRHKAEDVKPFMRGINSIQLMNDGKRWWIVSVYWEGERTDNPLPDKYLKTKGK